MTNTRKLAAIAMLSAISFLLMVFPQFPLIPGADFLKIDFSILPILLAASLFDLKSGYLVLFLRSLLKLFLHNEGVNDWIGLPMNIIAVAVFISAFILLGKRYQLVLTSLLSAVAMTVSMVILNLVYAIPLYAKFANFDIGQYIGISKYILAMVVPFNLLEGAIFAFSFYLIALALKRTKLLA